MIPFCRFTSIQPPPIPLSFRRLFKMKTLMNSSRTIRLKTTASSNSLTS